MKDFGWYWHRLRAMGPAEICGHVRKKLRQRSDRARTLAFPAVFPAGSDHFPKSFPKLRPVDEAPAELLGALRRDATEILAGRWRAFGHLPLQVDDPPRWHKDYLAGQDLATTESAFKLDHRSLPRGSDIKLIWELSRWHQLVRLAQASSLLADEKPALKCLDWLENWVKENPPFVGWNWTSALEVGMRLIQFTWIDALLQRSNEGVRQRLAALRAPILAPHVSYAWRYRSFGSSANNHLLGELAGLILATVRWPALAEWGAPIDRLQGLWEREVLAQFASDGGNREQALNYQLFSFEFCWQALQALQAAPRNPRPFLSRQHLRSFDVSPQVEKRLSDAAQFFWEVQVRKDPWDYGDSDSAFVTPVFAHDSRVVQEWTGWIEGGSLGSSIEYRLGKPPFFTPSVGLGSHPLNSAPVGDWWVYPATGIGIHGSGFWWLRWDLSPLGYLSTAAHGHLDALHLSIWLKGVAFVVDPGTGAYYADAKLRAWLASRDAHNGPNPIGVPEYPRRLGPFLWASHHLPPRYQSPSYRSTLPNTTEGILDIPGRQMRRSISCLPGDLAWSVEDRCIGKDGSACAFSVRWQFAPGTVIRRRSLREFILHRNELDMRVELSEGWRSVQLVELGDLPVSDGGAPSLAGTVSSAFRKSERAPFLLLTAVPEGDKPCVFATTFLVSAPS